MKQKTLLENLLLEHLTIEGADYIGTDRVDVFDIKTWAAAQEFIRETDRRHAGVAFAQSENIFDNNIVQGNKKLYFFVIENTNRVLLAALYDAGANQRITFADGTSTRVSDYAFENCSGASAIPQEVPRGALLLLPGIQFDETFTNAENNDDNDDNETVDKEADATQQNTNTSTNTSEDVVLVDNFFIVKIINGEGVVIGVKRRPSDSGNWIGDNSTVRQIPESTDEGIRITTIAPFAFYRVHLHMLRGPFIETVKNNAFWGSQINWLSEFPKVSNPGHYKTSYMSILS